MLWLVKYLRYIEIVALHMKQKSTALYANANWCLNQINYSKCWFEKLKFVNAFGCWQFNQFSWSFFCLRFSIEMKSWYKKNICIRKWKLFRQNKQQKSFFFSTKLCTIWIKRYNCKSVIAVTHWLTRIPTRDNVKSLLCSGLQMKPRFLQIILRKHLCRQSVENLHLR